MRLAYVVMQVVIAGGGLAGLRTAEELRARDFGGPITMIAAESRPPYDRPPLSKQALSKQALSKQALSKQAPSERTSPEQSPPAQSASGEVLAGEALPGEVLAGEPDAAGIRAALDTTLRADFTALGVDLRLGEPATGLELAGPAGPAGPGSSGGPRGLVRTPRGEYPFDRLVAATGAEPVALPGPGRQRFLRTHEDALELRARLRPGVRLVIVGAGWIGAELATAAAARGCRVAVVEAGPPRWPERSAPRSARRRARGTRPPASSCGYRRPSSRWRTAGSPWPAAGGFAPTRS